MAKCAAVLGVAAVLAAACGSDDDSSSAPTHRPRKTRRRHRPGIADSAPAALGDPTAFPVTFDTMFGETTIEALPQRVVSVGYTEGDLILALGVTPVAIRDWYGDQPNGLWPWAAETPAAQAGPIDVIPAAEINFEQVAALDPDVIFAIGRDRAGGLRQTVRIAPIVAQSSDYNVFGTPWDVAQLTIGKALGLEPEAQALVDDVNAQFAAAVEANPDVAGTDRDRSAITTDGTIGVFTDGDNRGHILTELGFAIPPEITEIAGASFYADISTEQIALLDNDLLVYIVSPASDRAGGGGVPLFQSLTAVQEGRTVFVDDALAGAMGFASTLSLPYALDALVPTIRRPEGRASVPGTDADFHDRDRPRGGQRRRGWLRRGGRTLRPCRVG